MPRKPAQSRIDKATALLDQQRSAWLKRPGVTAVDVGFKIKETEITSELALRVHVERKKHPAELAEHERFNISEAAVASKADQKDVGKKEGEFPIDVIEAQYEPARMVVADPEDVEAIEAIDRRSFFNTLIGGISCGNPRVTAGTLACIVYDKADCAPAILSNWHVLAGSTNATAGEEIWQPGRIDGGSSARTVANLTRFRLDRDMDAAVAKLNRSRPFTRDILGLNPVTGIEAPQLGMKVVKSGRTTGTTEGIIDGVSLSTAINYGQAGVVSFRDQIHIVPRPPWPSVDYEVSMGGDSGSVWINEGTGKAVGLHFAGETTASPTDENAIANRMVEVAKQLDFSFLPVICQTPDPGPTVTPPNRDALRAILCRILPFLCGGFEAAGQQGAPGQPAGVPWAPQATGGDVIELIMDAIYADLANGGNGSGSGV